MSENQIDLKNKFLQFVEEHSISFMELHHNFLSLLEEAFYFGADVGGCLEIDPSDLSQLSGEPRSTT